MNDGLEYIISSYSSLRLNGSPSKESPSSKVNSTISTRSNSNSASISHNKSKIQLNTPLKKQLITVRNSPTEIYELCMKAINFGLLHIDSLRSLNSSYLKLVIFSFIQLYKIDLKGKKSEVARSHHTFVVKLIELEGKLQTDYSATLNQIKLAYLNSEAEEFDIIDILTSKITSSQSINLKLLTLQVLYKLSQKSNFRHANELLEVFQNDEYLNNNQLSVNQKTSLIKLSLSFAKVSPFPQFTQCMNLKFLHYLKVFGLDFNDYITNMEIGRFIQNIQSAIQSMTKFGRIPYFIYNLETLDNHQHLTQTVQFLRPYIRSKPEYSPLKWDSIDPDSKSSKNLLKLLKLPNINPSLVVEELKCFGRLSGSLSEALCLYITPLLKVPNESIELIILFYVSQTTYLNKATLSLFDKLLANAPRFINSPEFLNLSLMKVNDLLIKHNQFKRAKNVSSVFYNLSLRVEGPMFKSSLIDNFLKIEKQIYIRTKRSEDLSMLSLKFRKACKFITSESLEIKDVVRLVLDEDFLNLLGEGKIINKLNIVDENFGNRQAFSSPASFNFNDFSEENKTILFILFAKYSTAPNQLLLQLFNRVRISQPINQMLCGIFFNDIPIVKPTQKSPITVQHSDSLIKTFYYLTVEMKTKSTSNLPKILQMYLTSWVLKNKLKVTWFELEFITKLVGYLKFVNYRRHLRKLFESLKKYHENNQNSSFSEWLLYNQIENSLALKLIDDESMIEIINVDTSGTESGADIDSKIRALSILLLKLRFHLINFNLDQLLGVSTAIAHLLNENPKCFSLDNSDGSTKEKFIQVLVLLSDLHYYRSKVLSTLGNQLESISSYSICIQISRTILKHDGENLQILELLSSSYINLLNQLIQLGISKDTEFFIEEFNKFSTNISKQRTLYTRNLLFLSYCYRVLGRKETCLEYKEIADTNYKYLNIIGIDAEDPIIDNHKLYFYKLLSDIYCQDTEEGLSTHRSAIRKFMNLYEREYKVAVRQWRMYYEYHYDSKNVDISISFTNNPYLMAMNNMLNSKKMFLQAQSFLCFDPVFSSLEDSALSIPAANSLGTLESPVSSSSKAKNLKNINKSITTLKRSQHLILNLFHNLRFLANYQINDLHKILSLDLLTLSGISNAYYDESIDDCFKLNDYSKHQPLVNEKLMLNSVRRVSNNQILPDFNLMNLSSNNEILKYKAINQDLLSTLPNDWLVMTIDACSFNGDLIISRIEKDHAKSYVLRLPLNRHSSRTFGEDPFLFQDALNELKEIISLNDATMSTERTSSVSTAQDRKEWHMERSELDERLRLLLEKIEFCWLGGFKGIFDQKKLPREQIEDFRDRFLNIIRQTIPSRNGKPSNGNSTIVEVDDFVVELFLRLGDPSELASIEVLEDLIYYLLDILLFHGEENAYDEIDIDSIYVQIEMLIKSHLSLYPETPRNRHTVLIIGKECQAIPWESLSCLRNSAVTRMPSLSLLQELLKSNQTLTVSKTNGSFILNPSGDLFKTQDRLEPTLEILSANAGWRGIVNIKPTEDQFTDMLTNSSIHIYVGHGGGESYIRSSTLKKLKGISPTLLLGCSSAALKDNNLLEPSGTVYSYLIGGCPLLVGNLWDVTDKDIDAFSLSVFEKWGLSKSWVDKSDNVDICKAVQLSRDVCKLKYLNGAAPVVYGLPLSLV